MDYSVERPQKEDLDELRNFFALVIADAFKEDGIGSDKEGIKEEIDKQMNFVKKDLESEGAEVYFFIAKKSGKIVGTIGQSEPNEFIKKHLKKDLSNMPEITSVYVLPEEQGKGLGSFLFEKMLDRLKQKKSHIIALMEGM